MSPFVLAGYHCRPLSSVSKIDDVYSRVQVLGVACLFVVG